MILRLPWRPGPASAAGRPVVVSATKFTYRRFRDLPGVFAAAARLLRGWRTRPGAIGVIVGGEPWKRTTYSVSLWESEDALRRFITAADHRPLIRAYRPRLEESVSTVWRTDPRSRGETWREALRRLESAG